MSQYTLVIDTSIHGAGIAFSNDDSGALDFLEASNGVIDSARDLPLMVERGMQKLGIRQESIRRVLVSQGPGSFTGIRVGMAYALGFVAGLKLHDGAAHKMAGVQSIGFLALQLSQKMKSRLLLFLAATKTTGCVVTADAGQFQVTPLDFNSDDVESFLSRNKDWPWVVVGTWQQVCDSATKYGVKDYRSMQGREAVLSCLESLGEALKNKSVFSWVDFGEEDAPRPIYLRKSTVEEKAMVNS